VIGVVYLFWGPLGLAPVREFFASYRRHPPGIDHEVVMLLNNVDGDLRSRLDSELSDVEHRVLVLEEPVQDIAAYAFAAERLGYERLCFLNTYTAALAPDWLAKLSGALDEPGAGLVGATGSWASLHSAVLNAFLLPNPYKGVVPERRIAREQMEAIERELEAARRPGELLGEAPGRSLGRSVSSTLKSLLPMPEQLWRFERFPAYHVRTNGFMLDREMFGELRVRRITRKMDAYLMESGRHSFTRQIHARGQRTLLVDVHGDSYDHDRWPASRTLWQGHQEGLLLADNQTRSYSNGGIDRRRLLSAFAWGPHAEPAPPPDEPSALLGAGLGAGRR
jgi:hypothetical protein